jgi:glutamate-ammonia-ligase adenylyltransferase
MLIKARISAGEPAPGTALLEFVEPLIYQSSLDFRAVESLSETRQRISEKLAARKRGAPSGIDVKLTPGGIRDIEFLVQCLQRLHGGRQQWVRHGGTMFALFRLRDKGFLTGLEYARLTAAYQFLRYVEHRLQVEEDRQTHSLPAGADELDLLARKMPAEGGVKIDGEGLLARLEEHLAAVQEIYHRVIHAQRTEEAPRSMPRAPKLAAAADAAELHRGRGRFERFLEQASGELVERLEARPDLAAWLLDMFGHSAYFADQLLRFPELLEEIGEPGREDQVALRGTDIIRVPLVEATSQLKLVPPQRYAEAEVFFG